MVHSEELAKHLQAEEEQRAAAAMAAAEGGRRSAPRAQQTAPPTRRQHRSREDSGEKKDVCYMYALTNFGEEGGGVARHLVLSLSRCPKLKLCVTCIYKSKSDGAL